LLWLDTIPLELHERLASLRLAEPRFIVQAERTLIAYLRAYVKERTDWAKPENYKQAVDKLETFLTKDVPLGAIKRSDVERWHRWMIHTLVMSPNTAGKNVKRCRQILNQAMNDRLIEQNPFRGVRIDLKSDKTKNRFMDEPTSKAILEACPNQEWWSSDWLDTVACVVRRKCWPFDGRTSIGSVTGSRFDRRKQSDTERGNGLFQFGPNCKPN
jgi:Phage integrase SAM-like domain